VGRSWPFAASGLILASLALAGMPLLAGFPAHQAVWEGLARVSLPITFWALAGSLGLFISAMRVLAALARTPAGTAWDSQETQLQRFFLVLGALALLLLGLFPQWVFAALDETTRHLRTSRAIITHYENSRRATISRMAQEAV